MTGQVIAVFATMTKSDDCGIAELQKQLDICDDAIQEQTNGDEHMITVSVVDRLQASEISRILEAYNPVRVDYRHGPNTLMNESFSWDRGGWCG